MITIAVVDDIDEDAASTMGMVRQFYSDDERLFHIERFATADDFLDRYEDQFSLIFFDIEMPGLDGMAASAILRMRDHKVPIIFTTKIAQLATKGYEVAAVGYLVKPFDFPIFSLTMSRALEQVEASHETRLAIASEGSTKYLSSRDIRYIEVRDHALLYHVGGGEVWKSWGSLKEVAKQLESANFISINRYCIVNMEWVESVSDHAVIIDGLSVAPSRVRISAIRQALLQYHMR